MTRKSKIEVLILVLAVSAISGTPVIEAQDPQTRGPEPVTPEIRKAPPVEIRHSPGDHLYFTAAWSPSAPETKLLEIADPESVKPPEGFTLADVEVAVLGDRRSYWGLFRPGAGAVLLPALDFAGLQASLGEQAQQGRCLTAFDAWVEEGKAFYAAVFSTGDCPPRSIGVAMSPPVFAIKHQSLAGSAELVDLETVMVDGLLQVSGLWRQSRGGDESWHMLGVSWESFHDVAHDMHRHGYRLVDLDVAVEPEEDVLPLGDEKPRPYRLVVSGAWRPADGPSWLGIGYHVDQLACAAYTLGSGHGMSGIHPQEGYPLSGKADWIVPPPTETKQHLLAVDTYVLTLPGIPTHGAPLHDSGTGGPP